MSSQIKNFTGKYQIIDITNKEGDTVLRELNIEIDKDVENYVNSQ